MNVPASEVYDYVLYQIGALDGFVKAAGGKMHHVKPHGALYNMAATNPEIADAIAKAIYHINPSLLLYGLANSEAFIQAAEKYNIILVQEAFADRTYKQDGTLTSRTEENALIKNEDEAIKQVLQMVKEGYVNSVNGQKVAVQAQTICLHGDGEKQYNLRKEYTEHLNKMAFLFVHRNKKMREVLELVKLIDITSCSGIFI